MLRFDKTTLSQELSYPSNMHMHVVSTFRIPNLDQINAKTSFKTEITFICHDTDNCDHFLIIEYLLWLLSKTNDKLVDAIRPLFTVNNKRTSKSNVITVLDN